MCFDIQENYFFFIKSMSCKLREMIWDDLLLFPTDQKNHPVWSLFALHNKDGDFFIS